MSEKFLQMVSIYIEQYNVCMAIPFPVRLVFLATMNDLTDVALYRNKRLLGSQNVDITIQLSMF